MMQAVMNEAIELRNVKETMRKADVLGLAEGNITQTTIGRDGWRSGVLEHGMYQEDM